MISKEEFVTLYKKWLNNECSDAEKELLDTYHDEMQLLDDNWHDDLISKDEVHDRIWRRLSYNREVDQPVRRFAQRRTWINIAAAAIIITSLSVLFLKNNKKQTGGIPARNMAQAVIAPGGNKAYLTMADGKRIALNDSKNGVLATQSGIKVTKSSNGMLVYHISNRETNQRDTTTKFNTIETPNGGQYQVVLDDGTKVWLNAMSSLRFPIAFNGNQRRVELSGEAYFEVAKNKSKPFLVAANGSTIRVLGTHFNINAYTDNAELTTTLLEGSVQMTYNGAKAILTPGQQGKIKTKGEHISVNDADIDEVMGWKNGLFVFRNENIVEVMKKVSRWYDIDVVYSGNIKDKEFGGTISRYKDINELLNNMELTQAIHYKIEGRRVILMN